MTSYLMRMPSGIPGDLSRSQTTATVEAVQVDDKTQFTGWGQFGKIVNGKFAAIETGDKAESIYGLLVRPCPTSYSAHTVQLAGVMRRGYMTVLLNAGMSGLNQPIYLRVANATDKQPIGGIEAQADGENTIEVPNARFQGEADAQGNVEISYNI